MIELRKFQRPLATPQSGALNFEHASLTLLARYQAQGKPTANLSIHSEWRDPVALRCTRSLQGAYCHG